MSSLRTNCELTSRLSSKLFYCYTSTPKAFYNYSVFQISLFQSLQYYLATVPVYSEPVHRIYLFNAFSNKEINCFSKKITTVDIYLHYENIWVRGQLPGGGEIDPNKNIDINRNMHYIRIYPGNQQERGQQICTE